MPDLKLLSYDVSELRQELIKYGDVEALAKGYGLPTWFVKYEVWACGVCKESPPIINEKLSKWSIEKLRKDLRIHKSLKNLSKHYKCDPIKLRESLLVTGIFPKAWKRRSYNWDELELATDLVNCNNLSELMIKYQCSRSVLIRALRKFNIDIPSHKRVGFNKKNSFTKDQLLTDYTELGSLASIAKKYKCSLYKIWYSFNKLEIPYRKMSSGDCKFCNRQSRIASNVALLQNTLTESSHE